MNFVAVTACPTGIAHTYMAAEKLEQVAQALGHSIKVETQGAMGIENPLSEEEIRHADGVILAADIAIEEPERFTQKTVIEVDVSDAIKHPEKIFSRF